MDRRNFIKKGATAAGGLTASNKILESLAMADQTSGSQKSVPNIKGHLPFGNIGKVKLSRMTLGGNLIGGWAHTRDLIYGEALFKAYHTRSKTFETFELAEACGINAFLTNPLLCDVIDDYWRGGGKIQFISDCGQEPLLDAIQKSIDHGACACYIQGGICDQLVQEKKFDQIAKALELIRRNGLPAGIGGHSIQVPILCEKTGLQPDFYMKTLHQDNYWSAHPRENRVEFAMENDMPDHNQWHDNIFDLFADQTVEFMHTVKRPWIAFKVLAGGAIHPKDGLKFAFENGADFICVGMFDFQIVEDVNIAIDVLSGINSTNRRRIWYG
jgi:hypothetical protein